MRPTNITSSVANHPGSNVLHLGNHVLTAYIVTNVKLSDMTMLVFFAEFVKSPLVC